MTLDLFLYETSSGEGDGGTEGEESTTETTSTESQVDTTSTAELVPRSELARANAEAKKYRLERNDLKKRVEDLEGLSKTELERERDRANTAEQERQDLQARFLVARAASLAPQAGVSIEAAQDAALLLDWDEVQDPDDDEQVLAAFKRLVDAKPYLAGRPGSADGGRGLRSGGEPESMNDLIRRAAGKA